MSNLVARICDHVWKIAGRKFNSYLITNRRAVSRTDIDDSTSSVQQLVHNIGITHNGSQSSRIDPFDRHILLEALYRYSTSSQHNVHSRVKMVFRVRVWVSSPSAYHLAKNNDFVSNIYVITTGLDDSWSDCGGVPP